ncbi:MAG: coenzyme F420 hydrogenase [Anaerolineales bacterium]|nr:coenzyme F420 hydrogenase [Anaerolineales bacterium]
MPSEVNQRLQDDVIGAGLCTHCGTCAGLSNGALRMHQTERGPLPVHIAGVPDLDEMVYQACPGAQVNYPKLYRWLFGRVPENWLVGNYHKIYLGYSTDADIRRQASSGGVISHMLIYLLRRRMIEGAIVLKHGWPEAWLSTPIIATTMEEIREASQSVYVPTPVNTILDEINHFEGRLAYVGLPDQVASIRRLQQLGHSGAMKIEYVIGPYVGTSMYLGAIRSFLRSNGMRKLEDVIELRYREGEWPGFLQIKLRSGEVIKAEKFYYNYLIPFYLTSSTLLSVDFTNELCDVSVGDAWHPQLEAKGEGYSVVVARTERGQETLEAMQKAELLVLDELSLEKALSMHGHMLDFKKRGAFIRNQWRHALGLATTSYGYRPGAIPFTRKIVEGFIVSLLVLGRSRLARRFVEWVPLRIIGPIFDTLRKLWKQISKPTKRSGLRSMTFVIEDGPGVHGR